MREIKHLSVHQWLRSAIPDSQQPISPIGFLFLKLPPPPCAVLLVHIYYCAKKDWLKINVALTFSLSILQWYRDCTHHASRDLLASWLGCVWCSSPYRLPSLSNSVGHAWITPRSVHCFICILLLLAGSCSAIAYILVCSISRNTWSRRLIMEEQCGSMNAKKGWNLRAHFWDKIFCSFPPVSNMATTCRWFSHQKPPFMADVPRLMTPKGRGKLPPATSALNCSSMSMAFGRPGLWGRSAQDAPRCAKYIHSQKSIDGSGICAMILLHIHVILRLERISKVIPSHWILVLVTSTFYVLFFTASLFFPLAGLCQLWPRRPHNRFRFLTARYAAPFSWKRARTILGKSPFPSCSSGTRGSPSAHWFPLISNVPWFNMSQHDMW